MIDEAHHHQAALLCPGGEELEEAEPDADEGEEDVDGRDSAGGFEDELEEIVDELGEDGRDDGGADEDPSQAGQGGEGDGEVDPGAEEGESSRGWGHIFTNSSPQHKLYFQLFKVFEQCCVVGEAEPSSADCKLPSLINQT